MKKLLLSTLLSLCAVITSASDVLQDFDTATTGVLIVDLQNSFTEFMNGTLKVPNSGQSYIDDCIDFVTHAKHNGFKIFASQDYHPANHMSFASNNPGTEKGEIIFVSIPLADGTTKENHKQMMWPDHCVQGEDKNSPKGANILIPAELINIENVIQKGTNPEVDSYSAFADDGGQDTGLEKKLRDAGITTLIIFGLATDFCVKYTVLDALKRGFKVFLVESLCRGLDLPTAEKFVETTLPNGTILIEKEEGKGTVAESLDEMKKEGKDNFSLLKI